MFIFNNWYLSDFEPEDNEVAFTIYGMDLGFLGAPTVIVKLSLFGNDLYVKEMYRAKHSTKEDIYKELIKLPNLATLVADNSEPRTFAALEQMMASKSSNNLNMLKTKKPKGSKKADINFLKSYQINIYSTDIDLKNEFEDYELRDINGIITDEPKDGNDDGIDAMIYAFRYANEYYLN